MSDYSEHNEQLQRLRELLPAASDVMPYLPSADLDLWVVETGQHLPTSELKRIADNLVRILAKHE
jgi:hypothetical protein